MKWAPALGLALALVARVGLAEPPAELDPVNVYAVTPSAGAWMILAASYSGNDAKELCRQLVLQLRNKHHLPAYVFNLAVAERQRQIKEEEERMRQARPGVPFRPQHYHIEDHWAVLIGGFADINAANAALPGVRKLPMPELKLAGDKLTCDVAQRFEPTGDGRAICQRALISPFQKAMCVPNPTIPHQPRSPRKYDPVWEKLNSEEEYSLLRCHKKFTFAVKEYQGAKVIQSEGAPSGIAAALAWLSGKGNGQLLDAAGLQAHNLAEALHKLNFETYVLHTRTSSVVTIGGFDNPDGEQAQRVRQQIQTFQQQLASAWAPTGKQDPLQLFPQPALIEVPHP
jgi:hypothetical protein